MLPDIPFGQSNSRAAVDGALLSRGTIVNRTYGTLKNLPGIYLPMFTNNSWSYLFTWVLRDINISVNSRAQRVVPTGFYGPRRAGKYSIIVCRPRYDVLRFYRLMPLPLLPYSGILVGVRTQCISLSPLAGLGVGPVNPWNPPVPAVVCVLVCLFSMLNRYFPAQNHHQDSPPRPASVLIVHPRDIRTGYSLCGHVR